MILNCGSCEKKFVVPDNAISEAGRLVQCSSCGNKWKQYPVKSKIVDSNDKISNSTEIKEIVEKVKKKKTKKKKTTTSLYSPEYLIKKHGIRINEKPISKQKSFSDSKKVYFGFYNYLIVFIILVIFTLRIIYFSQGIIESNFPLAGNYIEYLFESIKNIEVIIKDFFLNKPLF
jgi:predicted Zn finger-like uncharacterized protein